MKKAELVLKDFVSKLPYDGLKYLAERFHERMGPDLSEAVDYCLKHQELDKLLGAAKNGDEFWAVVDSIASAVNKECNRRAPELAHN